MTTKRNISLLLYWTGLFVAAGAIIIHFTLAFLLAQGYIRIINDYVIDVAVIIIVVVIFTIIVIKLDRRRYARLLEENRLVKRAKWILWPFLTAISIPLMWIVFTTVSNPFDGFPIIVLGLIVYWFIMNKERIAQKRMFAAILLMESVFMAFVPVIVDRATLRSGKMGVFITRNVAGIHTNEVIQTVEGFNASAGNNWSSEVQHVPFETYYKSCFSGSDIAVYTSIIETYKTTTFDPILYRPRPYASLEYTMNGTIIVGNISTMYTNTTIILRVNGTNILDSNQFEPWYEYYYFLNSTMFSKPGASQDIENFTNGYLIKLKVVFESYCGLVCGEYITWQQWYFLNTPTCIAWIIAFSEYTIS